MADTTPPATVKSAMRTLDIIEYVVARARPLAAQEIATALTIPMSSLSYLLSTLIDRGYLLREGRRYSAGPGLERLQAQAPAFTLRETVAPLVRALRVQLNETASFFVRNDWDVEALETESSEQALRYAVQTGSRAPLHVFAAGKAMLAAMSPETLDRYFAESDRRQFTSTTITTVAGLRADVARTQETGIARTHEEHTLGICGLGCVARINGEVVGAFSVAIPTVRFNPAVEQRASQLLLKTADLLALG